MNTLKFKEVFATNTKPVVIAKDFLKKKIPTNNAILGQSTVKAKPTASSTKARIIKNSIVFGGINFSDAVLAIRLQLNVLAQQKWKDLDIRNRTVATERFLRYSCPLPKNENVDLNQFDSKIGETYITKVSEFNKQLHMWNFTMLLHGYTDKVLDKLIEKRQFSKTFSGLEKGEAVVDNCIYSDVLRKLAKDPNSDQICNLIGQMRSDGLVPDVLCSVFIFEAAGRLSSESLASLAYQVLSSSGSSQSFMSVMTATSLFGDESEFIKKGILLNCPTAEVKAVETEYVNLIEMSQSAKDQLEMEIAGGSKVEEILLRPNPSPVSESIKQQAHLAVGFLETEWRMQLADGLQASLRQTQVYHASGHFSVYPFVSLISESEIVDFLLKSFQQMLGQSLSFKVILIFNLAEKFYALLKLKYRQQLNMPLCDIPMPQMTKRFAFKLGLFFFCILVDNIYYKGVPAIYATDFNSEMKVHFSLVKLYTQADLIDNFYAIHKLPMFCPPKRYASYLITDTEMLRRGTESQLSNLASSNYDTVLKALHLLSSCAWKVNHNLLDILVSQFEAGGLPETGLPSLSMYPNREDFFSYEIVEDEDVARKMRRTSYRSMFLAKKGYYENVSSWCTESHRLSIAKWIGSREFYLPQNLDFRGRVYPIPPHLSHVNCDLARSLIYFNKEKPLGKRGWEWLRIHVITVADLGKKLTMRDRLKLADELMDDIVDSGENPLTGRKWWMNDEAPWQTLAACIDISRALKCPNGPESYMSSLPVHQDGSCNGLQHYAAMGRDVDGAFAVNLTNSDKPQDVYQAVVDLLEEKRAADADNGVAIAQALEGFVVRRTIKQSVMTTVYGVTTYGAALQIRRQLVDAKFPDKLLTAASYYLAKLTLSCIGKIFTSSTKIQSWFNGMASSIAKQRNAAISWVTPLGLPVLQPYEAVPSKQSNAFPPNFVHSLDSCHMMMTALSCEQNDVTFAAVHDCFWTHACDVDTMNRICREEFVKLHSQPILENLSDYLIKTYGYSSAEICQMHDQSEQQKAQQFNHLLSDVPGKGIFDLNEVKDSVYFFS